MGKITRHNGPSIREFQSPAHVLRQRGKLGPYGGEARVETFTATEAAAEPHPQTASGQPDPAPEAAAAGAGQVEEPKPAEVRAWARANGYTVPPRRKPPPAIVEAYKAAHAEG